MKERHGMKMHSWLGPELERGLRNVTAPPELWDRIQALQDGAPQIERSHASRHFVWAAAASVALMTVGLSIIHRESVAAGDPQRFAAHCENPAELRAYARANPGLEVVSRSAPLPLRASVQQSGLACNLCHLD
jgi:hypothetical protein